MNAMNENTEYPYLSSEEITELNDYLEILSDSSDYGTTIFIG